jgi:decaprenyl-phosphate phosphoribosyltransferase
MTTPPDQDSVPATSEPASLGDTIEPVGTPSTSQHVSDVVHRGLDSPEHRRRSPLKAVVVALRPRQWVKNLLVYAVPLAAGKLNHRDALVDATIAFACFCAAASATYLINDVLDVESDRAHPRKKFRPIAAGELSRRVAVVLAVLLIVISLTVAALSTYPAFFVTLSVYLVATFSYSLGLKHEPVIELALIAAGFVLRAIAGGTATDIPMSPWFLMVAAFGSLFMAAGKRYSEFVSLGPDGRATRPTLGRYTATYLRFVWSLSAAIMLTAYCLWAFQVALLDHGPVPLAAWSVVPFILAVLRFALDIDRGDAGAPEDIALGDRVLQITAVTWVVMFALGAAGV